MIALYGVPLSLQVAIIGRDQVTTDIPEHAYMKLAIGRGGFRRMGLHGVAWGHHCMGNHQKCTGQLPNLHACLVFTMLDHAGGRDIDSTTRGLGGSCGLPFTSLTCMHAWHSPC